MSKVVLILGATSVGLGLVSLHLVKQLREGDATIAELREQVSTLEQQSQQAPAIFSVMPTDPTAAVAVVQPNPPPADEPKRGARAVTQVIQPAASPQPPSHEEAMRMMREGRERQRQLMQDPEYRQAMRVQTRNNLARQYPGVIEELGLDRRQAGEFFDMLADQQMRSNELMQPLWEAQPGDPADPSTMQERHRQFQQAHMEMQRNNDAELAARFGQDKVQAWKDYQSTIGMRFHLDQMRGTLAAQGLPLSDDLSKPMLKALAEAQKAEMASLNAAPRPGASLSSPRLATAIALEGNTHGWSLDWQLENTKKRNQRMLDAISPYLTYEQRTAIEQEQQAQLKMQEAQMRLMRERGENNVRGFSSTGNSAQLIPFQQ